MRAYGADFCHMPALKEARPFLSYADAVHFILPIIKPTLLNPMSVWLCDKT